MCIGIEKFDKIMLQRSGVDFSIHKELQDVPLLGKDINLPVRELLLIFFDIEKIFKFRIPEDEIINNSFTTYSRILEIIEKYKR